MEKYLGDKLFDRLKEHVANIDLGLLESIWTQYMGILHAFRAEENKISRQIEAQLKEQVALLIRRHYDKWCAEYMLPQLKQRTADLQERLTYEASEYVKVLSEIRGDTEETERPSSEEIAAKIAEWLRAYRPDYTTGAQGAGIDFTALVTVVVGEMVIHNTVLNVALPGIGLAISGILAFVRREKIKERARAQIVMGLETNRRLLLLDQRRNLDTNVEKAFKTLFEPISNSIAAEIDVINRNMTDVLVKRQKADFDADAFESEVRAFGAAVKANVRKIRQLAA